MVQENAKTKTAESMVLEMAYYFRLNNLTNYFVAVDNRRDLFIQAVLQQRRLRRIPVY